MPFLNPKFGVNGHSFEYFGVRVSGDAPLVARVEVQGVGFLERV